MWNPDDSASDLIDSFYHVDFPTEAELEALFAEILLIELIEAEVGQALDHLLTTTYTPTAA